MPRIALDANLLLLLVVGLEAKTYISKQKQLKQFADADSTFSCMLWKAPWYASSIMAMSRDSFSHKQECNGSFTPQSSMLEPRSMHG